MRFTEVHWPGSAAEPERCGNYNLGIQDTYSRALLAKFNVYFTKYNIVHSIICFPKRSILWSKETQDRKLFLQRLYWEKKVLESVARRSRFSSVMHLHVLNMCYWLLKKGFKCSYLIRPAAQILLRFRHNEYTVKDQMHPEISTSLESSRKGLSDTSTGLPQSQHSKDHSGISSSLTSNFSGLSSLHLDHPSLFKPPSSDM